MKAKKIKTVLELWKGIRKPALPPTRVMSSKDKNKYNRKNKDWKKEI